MLLVQYGWCNVASAMWLVQYGKCNVASAMWLGEPSNQKMSQITGKVQNILRESGGQENVWLFP